MLDQIPQDRQGPRTQGNDVFALPQTAVRRLETEGTEGNVVFLRHRELLQSQLEQHLNTSGRRGTTCEHSGGARKQAPHCIMVSDASYHGFQYVAIRRHIKVK